MLSRHVATDSNDTNIAMSLHGSHKRKKFLSEITVLYYDSFSRKKEKLYNEEHMVL